MRQVKKISTYDRFIDKIVKNMFLINCVLLSKYLPISFKVSLLASSKANTKLFHLKYKIILKISQL